MAMTPGNVNVYTVGHSTRSLDDFTELLKRYGIGLLADVRSIPRSRHTPQFNADDLQLFLPTQGSTITSERTGRLRTQPSRLTQSRLEECLYSGICRLHQT